MALLIDTYNVLHVQGVLPGEFAELGKDIRGLIELIQASRYRHQQATLVCDGAAADQEDRPIRAGTYGRVTVRFSGLAATADDLIGQLVAKSSTPRRLIVVSTDHQIQRTAKRRKCRVIGSESFMRQLATDLQRRDAAHRTTVTKSAAARANQNGPTQTEQWIRLFGIDEDAVAAANAQALKVEPAKPKSHNSAKPPATAAKPLASSTEQPQDSAKSNSDQPARANAAITPALAGLGRGRKKPAKTRQTPVRQTIADAKMPEAVLPSDVLAEAERLLAHPDQIADRSPPASRNISRRPRTK